MDERRVSRFSKEQLLLTGGTLLTSGILDIATHNPTTAFFGLCATVLVARHSGDIVRYLVPGQDSDVLATQAAKMVLPEEESAYVNQSASAKIQRMLGMGHDSSIYELVPTQKATTAEPKEYDAGDEMMSLSGHSSMQHVRVFSDVLRGFSPSLDRVYLAILSDGTPVYSDTRGLCHVALAGATGGGKSNIMRLLMAQLCKAGAQVLLLNPHYTRYDLDAGEDWTPYEPYLVHPPMECRKYEVIEYYLRQVALDNLPKRLERYANSQSTGKPYFIVIDELPAIVDHIPDAPKYLAKILREGRKVGLYLITSAQDFLVKTISPQGGGAIRDCYRTALYVGGDATTAKILLDMPAKEIQESELGKGTVMLRSANLKQAQLAYVPYVDNQSLYRLLGPSTYVASSCEDDDLALAQSYPTGEEMRQQSVFVEHKPAPPSRYSQEYTPGYQSRQASHYPTMQELADNPYRAEEMIPEQLVPSSPQGIHRGTYAKEIATWHQLEARGMATMRDFAEHMGINKAKAYELLCEMEKLRLIQWERKKKRL